MNSSLGFAPEFDGIDPTVLDRIDRATDASRDLNLVVAQGFSTVDELRSHFAGESHDPFYARHKHAEGKALETVYARMHNGNWGLSEVSGIAAISLIIRALTKAGDGILASKNIFGTTMNNFKRSDSQDGRKVSFISIHENLEAWKSEVERVKPRIVFLESPSNPLTDLADIRELSRLLRSYEFIGTDGVKYRPKLIVDSTFLPPQLQKPLDLGADIVVDSLTKFITGNNDVTGGMIIGKDPADEEFLFTVRNESGNNITSFQSLVLLGGLKTLPERIKRQSDNAMRVARWLRQHPLVEDMHYLGLEDHPSHSLAQAQFIKDSVGRVLGYGNMIPFTVRGTPLDAKRVVDNSGIGTRATLGIKENALSHPAGSTHFKVQEAMRREAGIKDTLIRVSVGLENPDTTIEKLDNGFATIPKNS